LEEPSGSSGDLGLILSRSYNGGLVWHIVVAPEGEYIIAASDGLIGMYAESSRKAIGLIGREYDAMYCTDRPPVCLKEFLGLMRRIGFVVCFRPNAKWAVDAASLPPYYLWNEAVPKQFFADFEALAALPPKEVLDKYDWSGLLADQEAHFVSLSTWMPVELRDRKVAVKAGGHAFDPHDPRGWEWLRSPAVALFHSSAFEATPPSFTRAELNEFLRLKERGQLAALLLTTQTSLFVASAPKGAQKIPNAEPDVPDLKTARKFGFDIAEKKRRS
jgi:hypothetical protein